MTLFITFEGPDGSGKTTQIQLLAEALTRRGQAALLTREPGGTRIGNAIRTVLHDRAHVEMSLRAEALLYNAARAQLVDEVIRPALAAGTVVLCDRFADSTLAYQGFGYGRNLAELRMLIDYATGGLTPNLTVFLDIDPAEGLRRKRGDADAEWNRMEDKALAFHRAAHAGYLQLAAQEVERWLVVDATQPVASIHASIWQSVSPRLRISESTAPTSQSR
ncbi:MAG: dTMP kinase [Caldilineaceae bacterium]|nr:dTMP kinase [Caldilineaceae bacterium]